MSTNNYPEYVWSKWHPWFVDMGYSRLDINQYEDGEWGIIEWLSRPVVPAITQWQMVISGLKNTDISRGLVEKLVKQNDMYLPEFWDKEEAASQKAEDSAVRQEKHQEEMTDKATEAVMRNPDLLERVMKNGMQEIEPLQILKHIPSYKF